MFDYKKKRFFWTNELNLRKCNKILVNLINMDQKKWSKKSYKYIKNFSVYNYKNTKLKKLFLIYKICIMINKFFLC